MRAKGVGSRPPVQAQLDYNPVTSQGKPCVGQAGESICPEFESWPWPFSE